jgi:2-aminoadipate transaminase
MVDIVKNLSITSRRIKGSAIRELLHLTNRPGVISFAGGLPSPESFPKDNLADIASKVLRENSKVALQYTPTEGLTELKDEIIKLMEKDGFKDLTHAHVLITQSSQQGLDLVGRVFINPSDPVLVELPTYIGGLQAFSAYGANFVGVLSDNDGVNVEHLKKRLTALRVGDEHYKFLYTVPDFQNPSGVTWSLERRKKVIEIAKEFDLILIDDSPYRDLRFEGERIPALHTLCDGNNVVTLRTFSKTFAPGLRLGWVVADPLIIQKLALVKQSVDLCTSGLTQLMAVEYLKNGFLEPQINLICDQYRIKRNAMLAALEAYMPKGVSWTKPQGGLFMWVTVPDKINTNDLFYEAVENNVAFVKGSAFYCDGMGTNTMRLNFSFPTVIEIDEGIKRLSTVIKKKLES